MNNIGKYHNKRIAKDLQRGFLSEPVLVEFRQVQPSPEPELSFADSINELANHLPANRYKLCYNHKGEGWDLYIFDKDIVDCKAQSYSVWHRGKTIVEVLEKYKESK